MRPAASSSAEGAGALNPRSYADKGVNDHGATATPRSK